MNNFEVMWNSAAQEFANDDESAAQPSVSSLIAATINEAVVQRVVDQLRSGDEAARQLATVVLREVRSGRDVALEAIRDALRRAETDDQAAWLLIALSYIGDGGDLDVALELANDSRPELRDAAASAISRLGWKTRSVRALEALCRLSRDRDDEVRFSSAYELAAWWQEGQRSPHAESVLRAALDDTDARVRRAAKEALFDRA